MTIPKEEIEKISCQCCGDLLNQFDLSRNYEVCEKCREESNQRWGGVRVAGPGKKIGRPEKKEKKVKVSYSISPEAKEKLDNLVDAWGIGCSSKSQFIESLIMNFKR